MSVTLRKASQIATQLLSLSKEIKLTNKVEFSIYHDAGTVKADVDKARQDQVDRVEELAQLLTAHGLLRRVIGRANVEAGVSDLLAEDAALSTLATRLSPLAGTPELSNIATAAQKMRRLSEKEETVYGNQEVEVVFDTLFANDEVKAIKKLRADIADRLLTKNTSTMVDLPKEVEDLMTKYKI